MTCEEARELLGALSDGEFEAERRGAVEGHLGGCAACSGALRELQALSLALRAAPYHRAPAGLRADVRRALRGGAPAPAASWRTRLAPGLAGAAMGFACALFLTRGPAMPAPGEAVARHSEAMLAGTLVEVKSSDHHQVKPWFSRHVDFSPPLPDLAPEGFPLTGGRTARLEGRDAAVLVYARRLHVIDVFVRPAPEGETPPRASSERGFNVLSWRKGGFDFTAVSDVNAEELASFGALMRAAS